MSVSHIVNVRGFIGGIKVWALGMIDVAIREILFKPFLVDVFLNTLLLGHLRDRWFSMGLSKGECMPLNSSA